MSYPSEKKVVLILCKLGCMTVEIAHNQQPDAFFPHLLYDLLILL